MISVEDKLQILELCARYNFHTDTGATREIAQTFTEDGVFDGPMGRFEGREAIVEFNEGLRNALSGSMHFTDNHIFDEDGDCIRHRCYLGLVLPSESSSRTMLFTYEDELVRIDGAWRFRIRKVRAFEGSA